MGGEEREEREAPRVWPRDKEIPRERRPRGPEGRVLPRCNPRTLPEPRPLHGGVSCVPSRAREQRGAEGRAGAGAGWGTRGRAGGAECACPAGHGRSGGRRSPWLPLLAGGKPGGQPLLHTAGASGVAKVATARGRAAGVGPQRGWGRVFC